MNRAAILAAVAFGLTFLPDLARSATFKEIVADQEQEGNPAIAAFDGDQNTRWAAFGLGRWIQFELYESKEVSEIGIGFANGDRDYGFDIRTSEDGERWSEPIEFQSGGKSGIQSYRFAPRRVRLVRVTVYGSDANEWANIHTLHAPGISVEPVPRMGDSARSRFVVTEWASHPAIANSVGISLDDRGRAYVTIAKRRKQSSLDIRYHQDLVKKDLSLTTVDERRAWYRDYLSGKEWVPDRNRDGLRDWRDLTVQKDNVTRVSDVDGDGLADSLRILNEYHSEVTGIAGGVLAVGSDVFVAVEPDFLRYVDEDGDGFPETERLVATGFQVHMGQGGHNLSGVALGPDGRIYWSLGDKGHHVKTEEGRVFHAPNSGAVFRCEMDGSNVERYSMGERNAQELAFDAYGNLFSMDNDGDYPGEMERALYITEGSDHGWRLNWQWLRKQDFTKISGIDAYNPWMEEKLFLPARPGAAAYITPTIGNFGPGPCGFTANPGTALGPAFADCFFMTNQKSEVRVFKFRPNGAFFAFEELSPIKGGVQNTGLAFGPDGALYAASYGGKRGVIHRFDVADGERHLRRTETQDILWRNSKEVDRDELAQWLDHPDQRVRMKGQFELVRRLEFGKLQLAFRDEARTTLGKLHAIWGIGQIARRVPPLIECLAPVWGSDVPELIAQAAKVVGDTPPSPVVVSLMDKLVAGLWHESPRVRFFTATALGNHGDNPIAQRAGPALLEILESSGASDPYLFHAAAMGIKGTMSPSQLAELSTHKSVAVRLGAIVALRRLRAAEVRVFLADGDELVLLEAARAIHDDLSIHPALPDLSAVLERDGLRNEALMRRVINAAFRGGSLTDLRRLEAYLVRGEGSAKLRRTALASILWWSDPPVLDPVEGRYRKHAQRDLQLANATVRRLMPVILADTELTEVLLNGVIERGEEQWLEGVRERNAIWPASIQVRFLDALARTTAPDLREFVQNGLSSNHAQVREKAREHAAAAGVPLLDLLLSILRDPKSAGKGQAVLQLAKLDDPRARKALAELIGDYQAGEAAPDWKLELWQAAKSTGIELPETPDRFEFGGDPKRGRKLVMEHAAAQCVRCHQVGDTVGSTMGPDLTKIGAIRDRAHLVASMLEPSRDISDGYGTVVLKTRGGQEFAGVLSKTTESEWTITLADSTEQKIRPGDVESHILTSAMPAMGVLLNPEEIRDVVSYLATLK